MSDEGDLDREVVETRARLAGLEAARRHARGGWSRRSVVALSAAVALIATGGGFLLGRASLQGELHNARNRATAAAENLATARADLENLQGENESLRSDVASAEANAEATRSKLGVYKEAMSWCEIAADNINNFAWNTGLGWLDYDTQHMIYRQINKCISPTGSRYTL